MTWSLTFLPPIFTLSTTACSSGPLLDRNWQSTCSRAVTEILQSLDKAICHTSVCAAHTWVRVLLSEPPWIPLSHNNNIPHHCPNHGHTTERKPGEASGRRAEVVRRDTKRGEEGIKEWFKSLKILPLAYICFFQQNYDQLLCRQISNSKKQQIVAKNTKWRMFLYKQKLLVCLHERDPHKQRKR